MGTLLLACASRHDEAGEQELISVSGVIKMTGSEGPDLRLIIDAGDKLRYEIVGNLAQRIRKLQQKRVAVRGWVVEDAHLPGVPPRLHVVAVEYETS